MLRHDCAPVGSERFLECLLQQDTMAGKFLLDDLDHGWRRRGAEFINCKVVDHDCSRRRP